MGRTAGKQTSRRILTDDLRARLPPSHRPSPEQRRQNLHANRNVRDHIGLEKIIVTRSRLLAFTAALAVTMACDSNPLSPSDITGTKWRLVSIAETGTTPTTIDDPSKYTLEFLEDGRVGVKSDCNTCGGPYSLSGSSIEIGPVVCTKAFCGDTSRDGAFTRALDKARTASVDDNELTIMGDGVRLTLVRD